MLLLIESDDVDINVKDNVGRTPFSWAARNGHEAVVRLLIESDDVDINAKENDGQTPLSLAAIGRHEAIVRLLKDRLGKQARDSGIVPASSGDIAAGAGATSISDSSSGLMSPV